MAINFSNDVGLAGIQQGNTANRPQSPVLGLIYYNTELGYFENYTKMDGLLLLPLLQRQLL